MSKHFKAFEFACPCCNKVIINHHLIAILEFVRAKFDSPVSISSGYRCKNHNEWVIGRPRSKHLTGMAADIKVEGVNPEEVYRLLDKTFPSSYGVGLYKSWVHVDVRFTRARWKDV